MTSNSRNGARANQVLKSKCPLCGVQTVYSQTNPFRPFCSESCRDRDFTAWASDRYQIPVTKADDDYSEDSRQKDETEEFENY